MWPVRKAVDFCSRGGESGSLLKEISELKAYHQCQVHKEYDGSSGDLPLLLMLMCLIVSY